MLEQMIIAVAVLLPLFSAELTQSSSTVCFQEAQIKIVDVNATAFVACPALAEHEKPLVSLYKGKTKLLSTNLSAADREDSRESFQVHIQNSSVSYKIPWTEYNDTGLYKCDIEGQIRTSWTILLIKGALQPTECTVTCDVDNTIALAVGCGLIIAYDVLITIIVCYFRHKLNTTDAPENPYINTRPIGFQRRR